MMRWIAALSLVLTAACGPSVNPKQQSATHALLAKLTPASHSVAAMSQFKPLPWAVGQWVVYKDVDIKNQRPSVRKIGVVAQEAGGFWIETDTQDYFHHTISKTLYSRIPRNSDDIVDAVIKIVTKTDDQAPQTMDFTSNEPGVQMMKGLMKSTIQGVSFPQVEAAAAEAVTVPAGSFAGCLKTTATVSFGPIKATSTGWFHPAVPINAMVKGEATDGSWMTELVDFGTSGATSAM